MLKNMGLKYRFIMSKACVSRHNFLEIRWACIPQHKSFYTTPCSLLPVCQFIGNLLGDRIEEGFCSA
jgi:hypothetical protein